MIVETSYYMNHGIKCGLFNFSPNIRAFFFLVLYSRQCHMQSWLAFTQFMGSVSVPISKAFLHIFLYVLK